MCKLPVDVCECVMDDLGVFKQCKEMILIRSDGREVMMMRLSAHACLLMMISKWCKHAPN